LRYSTSKNAETLKSRSKVTHTAYGFLLTFHSNHGPISYYFRDKRRLQSKIAKFSQPPWILQPPLKGSIGTGYRCWVIHI